MTCDGYEHNNNIVVLCILSRVCADGSPLGAVVDLQSADEWGRAFHQADGRVTSVSLEVVSQGPLILVDGVGTCAVLEEGGRVQRVVIKGAKDARVVQSFVEGGGWDLERRTRHHDPLSARPLRKKHKNTSEILWNEQPLVIPDMYGFIIFKDFGSVVGEVRVIGWMKR